MNYHNDSNYDSYYNDEDENRQFFNIPGFWGIPGFPGPGGGGQFPGPGAQPPSFPGGPGGGSQFPGGPSGSAPSGPPTTPPPSFTPEPKQIQTFAVDPGAIRGCMFRFTYVWLQGGGFWFFPVFVGRRSVSGWRWIGFRWVYVGIDLYDAIS